MNARKVIPVTSMSELAETARVGRACRTMLSMLVLIWAGGAWCQIPRSPAGIAKELPGQTHATPASERARQQQRAQMVANAAAIPVDSMAATLATANYSFVIINVPNAAFVQPNAVNDAGVVAGYYDDASYNSHGFIWQDGNVTTIDYPGALQTLLTGINGYGIVSGVYTDASNNNHGFTYSLANSTWTVLPAISLPDIPGDWPWVIYQGTNLGINNHGDVIGCASSYDSQALSWIWHPGSRSYSYFTIPGAAEATTCAQVFNNSGHAVGEMTAAYGTARGSLAFLQDGADDYQTFDSTQLLTASSFLPPFGVNDSDTVVGTAVSSTGVVGFIRARDGVLKLVNDTAYAQTYVTGINNHQVLVGDVYDATTGANPGFIAYPKY
jgi:hypothetical protein